MSLDVFCSISTIVSLVSVLYVMTDFKTNLIRRLLFIGMGSILTLSLSLTVMSRIDPSIHSTEFLLLAILPIGILFGLQSKWGGMRFAYTFVLSLSITFYINTLCVLMMSLLDSMILSSLIAFTILIALCVVMIVNYKSLYFEGQRIMTKDWAGFSITPSLCLVMLILLSSGKISLWFTMDHFDIKVILFAIIAITHIQVGLNVQKVHERQALEKNNQILEAMLRTMKQDLSDQIDTIRMTKLHRHDLHHHLSILSAAAHQSNLSEFDTYVKKLNDRLDKTSILSYCLNFTLNAVFSVYLKKAQDHGILVTHAITIPEVLPVEDIDLALILANAIENAINANKKITRSVRSLDLKLYHEFNTLTLILENPISGSAQFSDGLPVSSDPDHGFGTLGIRTLAERYQGSALFSVKKGRFTLIVQLPV